MIQETFTDLTFNLILTDKVILFTSTFTLTCLKQASPASVTVLCDIMSRRFQERSGWKPWESGHHGLLGLCLWRPFYQQAWLESLHGEGEGEVRPVRVGSGGWEAFSLFRSVLHSVQADVPTGNLCWGFWSDTSNNTLFKRPRSDNQPVNDIRGDADDRRSSNAVAQDDTPVGIIILEKS